MRDLLLLPGWGMPVTVFDAWLPLFAPQFRVRALALPRAPTLAAMASAVLAQAPPRACWFGWSLGGMVAAQAARQAPARVAVLATFGSNLRFVADAGWPQAMAPAAFAAFRAQLATDAAAARARFAALATGDGEQHRRLRKLLAPVPVDAAALAEQLQVLATADLRAPAAAPACPSLWLYGEHDALVPAAVAPAVAARLPGAQVRVLAGLSHFPFSDAAAGGVIGQFLAEQAA